MLEFTRAVEADWEEMNHVWAWVYTNQPPDEALDPEPDNQSRWLVRHDGKPVSVCQLHHYHLARGDADLSCGGVGGVATLVEARQSGAAHVLMEGVVRAMHEQGFAVSCLYAYKESYYRRFGYEASGWRWQLTCPGHRLPKTEVTLPVRQIMPDEVTLLDSAYIPFIRNLSGSHIRSADDWKKRLGKKPQPIYAVGNPIEAYAWVNLKEFWGEATVGEIAWSTRQGYESILGVLRGAMSNQGKLIWNEPPNSSYLTRFLDQGATATLARPTMFRATNVPVALAALHSELPVDFTIEVRDSLIPENRGPWRVISKDGHTEIEKASEADISLSIHAFSQALMGQPSLIDLADCELVDIRDAEAFLQAVQFLSPLPVVCMEFF